MFSFSNVVSCKTFVLRLHPSCFSSFSYCKQKLSKVEDNKVPIIFSPFFVRTSTSLPMFFCSVIFTLSTKNPSSVCQSACRKKDKQAVLTHLFIPRQGSSCFYGNLLS